MSGLRASNCLSVGMLTYVAILTNSPSTTSTTFQPAGPCCNHFGISILSKRHRIITSRYTMPLCLSLYRVNLYGGKRRVCDHSFLGCYGIPYTFLEWVSSRSFLNEPLYKLLRLAPHRGYLCLLYCRSLAHQGLPSNKFSFPAGLVL